MMLEIESLKLGYHSIIELELSHKMLISKVKIDIEKLWGLLFDYL